jgi:uncharacterized protein
MAGGSNERDRTGPGDMSPAARPFDPYRLARDRGVLEGSMGVPALERLSGLVVGEAGPVSWRIEGGSDEAGHPAVTVAVDGVVVLECQRCLRPMRNPIAQRTMALLARSEAEGDALDDACDLEVMVVDGLLDPQTIVEDELLLSLPFAPMHPPGECEPPPDCAGAP